VPGDISSAAFFIVAASILAGSSITITRLSLNPSRTGIIRVLRRMGADIRTSALRSGISRYEPMGDVSVKYSSLKGTVVRKKEIPSLIDELPVLMVAASLASGRTVFEGVEELRVKETDRIKSMVANLTKMGADIKAVKVKNTEKIVITGVKTLKAARVRSFGDHRTAMSMIVAALRARGVTCIDDTTCINKSFPGFWALLESLVR
jgi:3-phosphoshikimate 1-carboxyvinyltransferase